MYDSLKALGDLPLMQDAFIPSGVVTLGLIDNVFIAVKKLKEFHDTGKWREMVNQYKRK